MNYLMRISSRLKIICLNVWGGMAGASLTDFFVHHQDTDIFCLQEVYNGGGHTIPKMAAGKSLERVDAETFRKIQSTLPNHRAYFTPQYVSYLGLAIFVHRRVSVLDTGDLFVYGEEGYVSSLDVADHARKLQYVTIRTESGPMTILNIHAAWQAIGKTDTPERLEQSRTIIDFTDQFSHPLLLCGDFNLLPQTESIRMIERAGWENLIRTFGITSTRTRLYEKEEQYADYVFVKNGVRVSVCETLSDIVSDHVPLFVECDTLLPLL